jgi:FkbM family methyltransferase
VLRELAAATQRPAEYVAARSGWRNRADAAYQLLPWHAKALAHRAWAKLFRSGDTSFEPGDWRVRFAGRDVIVPLSAARAWLDWDVALSVLGHDPEIKRTYAALVRSPRRPRLFFDVGANYGTHSLLLLAHGVRAVTFEPNLACAPVFEELCRANGVCGRWESVALGAEEGDVELCFDERDTWSGSTCGPPAVDGQGARCRCRVPRTTLDAFVDRLGEAPDWVKLDVEGAEHLVLAGARRTLERSRPRLIFESWPGAQRTCIAQALQAAGYRVCALPWDPAGEPHAVAGDAFRACPATNFLAVPD